MGTPGAPPDNKKPPGPTGFEDTGELTLPELERMEPSKRIELPKPEPIEELHNKHVDLQEQPPPDAVAHPENEKKEHPELLYQEPEKPKSPILTTAAKYLTPERRRRLDGWAMFAAVAGMLGVLSSPLFLEALTESPIAHLTGPGAEVHLNIIPTSGVATGIFLNGFRVPNERDIVVHVPYNGAYKLEIHRKGFEKYERVLVFTPPKAKVLIDEQRVEATLVASTPGSLNVTSSAPCSIEISDGITYWDVKTPVHDLKVPPADYTVRFVDPNCGSKEFFIPVREGSQSHIVWDFPPENTVRIPAGH